jgi:hypothetical protein
METRGSEGDRIAEMFASGWVNSVERGFTDRKHAGADDPGEDRTWGRILNGRVAVVTGAARGIGGAAAVGLGA